MYENVKNVLPLKGNGDKKTQTDSIIAELKVLSYNVKLFDFYKKNDDQEHFNQIVNYIMNVDADVVCLQEFGYYNMKGFLSQAELLAIFSKKYKYNHLAYKLNSKQLSTYGVATFSKYPIIEENEVDYDAKYNFTIYSDIKIDKKIIRVYNCHLESNQLTVDDKKEMYKLIDDASQKNISETTGRLTRKLGVAYKKRAYQAMQVAKSIQQSPHDVFVCGDFNDSPVSYAYTKIKGDLSDAFVETSQGMGITYNEPPFLFRIDYILHSKALSSKNFKIDNVNYSDHYPISCIINYYN